MRIIQVINSFGETTGGAERLAQDLHLDLLEAGVDAHLLAIQPSACENVPNATSLDISSPYDPRALLKLAGWFRLFGPVDVIHAHLFPTSAHIAVLRMAGVLRCPIVFTEHNTSNRRRQKRLGRVIDPTIYRQYNRIFAISDGTAKALVTSYPKTGPKIEVIRNGASLRYNEPMQRVEKQPVEILSIGRLARAKNYPTALEVMRQLKAHRYTVLGDGDLKPALEQQIAQNNLLDVVTLAGHQTDITPYLEAADIFLIPSHWEGFGLAAVEAMNASLPVIAADVAGLRDVIGADGECGFLVPPDDVDAIRNVAQKLIDDPSLRRRMGVNAFDRSLLFDKTEMAREYIAAYQNLTSK